MKLAYLSPGGGSEKFNLASCRVVHDQAHQHQLQTIATQATANTEPSRPSPSAPSCHHQPVWRARPRCLRCWPPSTPSGNPPVTPSRPCARHECTLWLACPPGSIFPAGPVPGPIPCTSEQDRCRRSRGKQCSITTQRQRGANAISHRRAGPRWQTLHGVAK